MLAKRSKKIDLVVELKVDEAILLGRVEQRIKSGQFRADDKPETVKQRLAVYRRDTAPLLDYYRGQAKLVTVDGMAPIESVTKAIDAAIEAAARRR
jgi:adenylate kinase